MVLMQINPLDRDAKGTIPAGASEGPELHGVARLQFGTTSESMFPEDVVPVVKSSQDHPRSPVNGGGNKTEAAPTEIKAATQTEMHGDLSDPRTHVVPDERPPINYGPYDPPYTGGNWCES